MRYDATRLTFLDALEPVRRRGDRAADSAEALLELLRAIELELIAVVVGELLVSLGDPLLEFVIVQHRARPERLGALKRNALEVVAVVDPLQVGLAPRRLRDLVSARLLRDDRNRSESRRR